MLKKFLMTAAIAVAVTGASSQSAEAAIVQFSTTGGFDLTSTGAVESANSFTVGDITITFTGIVNQMLLTPSDTSYGVFTVTSTATDPFALTAVDVATFTLNIAQSLPTVGSTTFTGALQGSVSILQGLAYVQFASVGPNVIGGISYFITEADNGTPGRANLNAANAQGVTLEGRVVPEPTSVVLLGLGLFGAARAARRRRA